MGTEWFASYLPSVSCKPFSLLTRLLLDLPFNPEDGGEMFLRNIG
jgi:hypothetical protein